MFARKKTRIAREIDPDEIFLDSSNLPGHEVAQFEGRVEHPVSKRAIFGVGAIFIAASLIFTGQAYQLQVQNGDTYAQVSRDNRLSRTVLFAPRGVIYDRNGTELAWNEVIANESTTTDVTLYARRAYTSLPGLAHTVGFVRYPKMDTSGRWWREEYVGISGSELAFDAHLAGQNGSKMAEANARGEVQREHIVVLPTPGKNVELSIDADVQSKLHTTLLGHANTHGFRGGASVIMDVTTGEILALVSVPEYDNAAFAEGETDVIRTTHLSERLPALNRAIAGAYTPGSIVKPFFAAAALQEGIISPEKEIESTGTLVVPNPYYPDKPSVFRDWKAHGWTDMRDALSVSSDIYFYTIGGGFASQAGLGILRISEYARRFGFGATADFVLWGEVAGVVPTPEWKEKIFGPDDPWRIGDTYNTAIGQYGMQVTPLQAVRAIATIANDGLLVTPILTVGEKTKSIPLGISRGNLVVVREGMRRAVAGSGGTASALAMPRFFIAAKTGTEQTGARNEWMNSWVVGFWPYENPRFAFATLLEHAPAGTLAGASPAMRPFFEWLAADKMEYI